MCTSVHYRVQKQAVYYLVSFLPYSLILKDRKGRTLGAIMCKVLLCGIGGASIHWFFRGGFSYPFQIGDEGFMIAVIR